MGLPESRPYDQTRKVHFEVLQHEPLAPPRMKGTCTVVIRILMLQLSTLVRHNPSARRSIR